VACHHPKYMLFFTHITELCTTMYHGHAISQALGHISFSTYLTLWQQSLGETPCCASVKDIYMYIQNHHHAQQNLQI
jgi:hypothetical protein